MRLVTVDPGKLLCAIATFEDARLVNVWIEQDDQLDGVLRKLPPLAADALTIEVPQVYGPAQSKGNPNDLIDVALVAGAAARAMGGTLRLVRPREWKGQVPKSVHNKRVMRKLNDDERELVTKIQPASIRHNAIDAVGIGLWELRR